MASYDPSLAALDPQVNLYPLVILLNNAVIFAQRMAFPTIGQQDAFQIGMSLEANPEHVIDFALQPVGCWPDRDRAAHHLSLRHQGLHPTPPVARTGGE